MNFCWRSEALSLLTTELLEESIVYNRDWVLPQISGGSSADDASWVDQCNSQPFPIWHAAINCNVFAEAKFLSHKDSKEIPLI